MRGVQHRIQALLRKSECLYRDPYDRLFLGRYAADDRLERSSLAMLAGFDHLAVGPYALVWVTGDATPDLYAAGSGPSPATACCVRRY